MTLTINILKWWTTNQKIATKPLSKFQKFTYIIRSKPIPPIKYYFEALISVDKPEGIFLNDGILIKDETWIVVNKVDYVPFLIIQTINPILEDPKHIGESVVLFHAFSERTK
jgi:hypothetical protein